MASDIENLLQCVGKDIELHPVHGRDVKGILKHVDRAIHVLYVLEESGNYTQIPLKRVGTIRYPKGFVPKFGSEDSGELPTDSSGNHIPESSPEEIKATTTQADYPKKGSKK